MEFHSLGLSGELLQAVKKQGYTSPTPIQAKSIPAIIKGKDLMGGAQTGTGKTAAFALPILHNLSGKKRKNKNPRALVLTPTRELAAQVGKSFLDYGAELPLKTQIVFGGVKINPQISTLRRGCDILVATPGRLLDHLAQETISMKDLEVLVLDEADRMLDMGFIRDIRRILKFLPPRRQNLFFSATYSSEIRTLAEDILHNPVSVEVAARNKAADRVEQFSTRIPRDQKLHLLTHLIKSNSWYQVLVFSRTKHGADRLSKKLNRSDIPSGAIHGDKRQNTRVRTLEEFRTGKLQVLVATDVAARGIHLEELGHVVNFDLPQVAEDYIHRIGRTGRAGKSGQAVSFISPEESDKWKAIERLQKDPVKNLDLNGFVPVIQEAPARGGQPQTGRSSGNQGNHGSRRTGSGDNRQRRSRPPRNRRSAGSSNSTGSFGRGSKSGASSGSSKQ
ncbi:MAG: DEAD/DEAH box helicase [Spirochaetales bacterium]|nr:DEAD/DEAH box helicase [Spirochaetales bacterium]